MDTTPKKRYDRNSVVTTSRTGSGKTVQRVGIRRDTLDEEGSYRQEIRRGRSKLARPLKILNKGKKKLTSKKQVKALRSGALSAAAISAYYPLQLLLAMFAIFMMVVNAEWYWTSLLIPEISLFGFAWVLLMFIGTLFMAFAAVMFTVRGVNIFHWKLLLSFVFCLVAHWSPILFIFPWVFFWIAHVILSQKTG